MLHCYGLLKSLLTISSILVISACVFADTSKVASSTVLVPYFLSEKSATESATLPIIPDPIEGTGKLSVTVESFAGVNPKRASQVADRAELWLGDHRISALDLNFLETTGENSRRLFQFPEITLKSGYYFVTLRLYSPGALHGRRKSYEKTFQVGIHPERVSKINKKVPFFHW